MVRGWCHRRDREESSNNLDYTRGGTMGSSHWNGFRQSRDRSHETMGRRHDTSYKDGRWHPNAALYTMSRVLRRVAQLPFSDEIEHTEISRHFNHLPFTYYDGKTNPMEHVNHYIQMMSPYSQNDRLICKVFPSSLRPMTMRWFNGLRKWSIHSFGELI